MAGRAPPGARAAQGKDAMTGHVRFEAGGAHGSAQVVIANPGKMNALSVSMWNELRAIFDTLNDLKQPPPRLVVVRGEGADFAAGGDIAEFPSFRFDADKLRRFHEFGVAPALQAMFDCEIPLLAAIDGACVGGGLEIAACCDIRVCTRRARFGIPIARLGFPMAPLEAQMVERTLGRALLAELLLEARLLGADEAARRGIVQRVVDDGQLDAEIEASAARIAALSPQSLRLNKRTLRQLAAGGPTAAQRHDHFGYADSAEHREGLAAFVEKRTPKFQA